MKGIIFSTYMVQAILAGRKTQTRRIIKPQPLHDISKFEIHVSGNRWGSRSDKNEDGGFFIWAAKCKYQVGDVLWVKETWASQFGAYLYKTEDYGDEHGIINWKPSIHMPKDAARIFLEIINIRVERLQDISEEDAIKEGVERCKHYPKVDGWKDYSKEEGWHHSSPTSSFKSLWHSINGEESWNANPWVWAYTFEIYQP